MYTMQEDLFDSLSTWKWIKIKQRNEDIQQIIRDWYLTKNDVSLLKWISFTDSNIIEDHIEIKFLLKLIKKNLISLKALKCIVSKAHQDIEMIKKELSRKIPLEKLSMENKVLVMNILNIWE